jgi:hypothetical protein
LNVHLGTIDDYAHANIHPAWYYFDDSKEKFYVEKGRHSKKINCIILKSNLDIKGRREQRLNADIGRLRTNEGPEFGGGSDDDDVTTYYATS